MRRHSFLLFPLLLAGCVGGSTGVVQLTKDTYMVSKQDVRASSGSTVKVDVYKEANAYCASQGKELVRVSERTADAVHNQSMATAELQFKCR